MSALVKAGAQAALELAPSPLKAFAILFGGLLGRPDLDDVAIAALQEDIVRLHGQINSAVGSLSDEVRAKIDPLEAMELTAQTVANMSRTAKQEKRAQMITVLVHGLTHPENDETERRLFVRAVGDLDLAHVDLLRRIDNEPFMEHDARKDLMPALVAELVARGFVERHETKSSLAKATTRPPRVAATFEEHRRELERDRYRPPERTPTTWVTYSLTPLGQRFVHHLRGTSARQRPQRAPLRRERVDVAKRPR